MASSKGSSTSKGSSSKRAPRKSRKSTSSSASMNLSSGQSFDEINRDYRALARDFKRLGKDLWEIPQTKYVVGALAAGSLFPLAFSALRRVPKLGSFFSRNVDVVSGAINEVGDKINERISDLKNSSEEEVTDARH